MVATSSVEFRILQPFKAAAALSSANKIECARDKSLTHRAIIFSAMATGKSEIMFPLMGEDCLSTVGVFKALGVGFQVEKNLIIVDSKGWDAWQSPVQPVDFGNSGTTARLLIGVFAATPGLVVTCAGDESLSKRPMGRVVSLLRKAGADIDGKDHGNYLPLTIRGKKLSPLHHTFDKASAQVKSAVILAGINIIGKTSITLPSGGRDHTEKMLQQRHAKLAVDSKNGEELITIEGTFRPPAGTFVVPVDPSSAAFFGVLAALLPRGKILLNDVLNNATRCGFVEVLRDMGVSIAANLPANSDQEFLEPVLDLAITAGSPLKGVVVKAEKIPTLIDEVPVLAVAAMFAKGESRFHDLKELRVKESDRLELTAELIRAGGGSVKIVGDDLIVGGGLAEATPFIFDPHGDHRLAMAAAVLATRASGPCKVLNPSCVDVSFPGFFNLLGQFTS
jgi:3-phosphoshikimate 1-carboxyvinyltransferase